MTKGKLLRSNPLPRPSSIGDVAQVLVDIAALNNLSAANITTEINKVATCTTNKLTDARVIKLDDISASQNYSVFKWESTKTALDVKAITGTWVYAPNAAYDTGDTLNNSSDAQNDMCSLGVFYAPQTANYTAYMIFEGHSDKGIVHIFVNHVDVAQIDTYRGAQDFNVIASVSLGSLTLGVQVVAIKIATKHGSSSGYKLKMQSFHIAQV